MAQDEIWWVGFLASTADSSGSNIGVPNVGFFFISNCFYVHSPRSPIQSLCPPSTHSHVFSVSTTHSVSWCFYVYCPVVCCFFVHYPRSLVLFLCPLPTQSHADSMFVAHSVSCYFCIHCPNTFKGTLHCSTKVSIRWLALLLPLHEATALNLSLEPGQKDRHFVVSLSSYRQ
jgi:hypothetical protein